VTNFVANDPHSTTRTITYGTALEEAQAAMILLHGRGASPEDILGLAAEIDPGGVAYLAPAAFQAVWYPQPFLSPQSVNQPWLDSALRRVDSLFQSIEEAGIPPQQIILLGFSQGACLSLEYAARNPRNYGGVAALSGGLIGSEDDLKNYPGFFDHTPILLGCSNVDPFIPEMRVRQSGDILTKLGANVDLRLYPGMGHMVNRDELDAVAFMLEELQATTS
jgi:predicted esterase